MFDSAVEPDAGGSEGHSGKERSSYHMIRKIRTPIYNTKYKLKAPKEVNRGSYSAVPEEVGTTAGV